MNRPGALIYARDQLGLDIGDATTQSNKEQPNAADNSDSNGSAAANGNGSNGDSTGGNSSGNGNDAANGNGQGSNDGSVVNDDTDSEIEEPEVDDFDTFLLVDSQGLFTI